jgi:hypothetical protein
MRMARSGDALAVGWRTGLIKDKPTVEPRYKTFARNQVLPSRAFGTHQQSVNDVTAAVS